MDTVRYSWKRDRFLWIFQKESALHGNSYYKKEVGRPFSFSQVSVQKWIDKESTRKKSVFCPQSSKTVFMNTVKKSRLIDSTLPAFLCFKYRLRCLSVFAPSRSACRSFAPSPKSKWQSNLFSLLPRRPGACQSLLPRGLLQVICSFFARPDGHLQNMLSITSPP